MNDNTEPVTIREPNVPAAMEHVLQRGTAVGRYIVIDQVGEGGMGTVYSAYDHVLDRKVALKLIAPRGVDAPQGQLIAEAQAMAKLSHPSIVQAHDVGEHCGRVFLAMEYVDGTNLREHLELHLLTVAAKLSLLRQIGEGLAAAHAAGIVHRDFKPDNVLVDPAGHAKIADFGLAKHARLAEVIDDSHSAGTPGYMSPEQHHGKETDARTDQYAFCVTAVELLTGKRDGTGELGTYVSNRISRALVRGLNADPAARWVTMNALIAELAPPARRWVAVVSVAAVVIASVTTAVIVRSRTAPELDCDLLDTRANALVTTGVPSALGTQLAGWKVRWTKIATRSCEAARAGTQAPALHAIRQSCLDFEAATIEGLTRDLRGVDADAVQVASVELPGLLARTSCDRDQELLGWAPSFPAAEHTEELLGVQREVLRAAAVSDIGDLPRATKLFAAVMPRVDRLKFYPIIAEAYLLLGTNEMRAGNGRAASTALFHAITAGEASRSGRIVTDAWIRQVYVAGNLLAQFPEALAYADIARALITRDPSTADDDAEVTLDGSVGLLLADHGRAQEALPMLEHDVAFFEKRDAVMNLVAGLGPLAAAYMALDRMTEARGAANRAVVAAIGLWGPTHPNVAILQAQLVEILVRGKWAAEAIATATHALAAPGLDPGINGVLLRDRGYAHLLADDPAAARTDLEAAVTLLAANVEPDDGELQRARFYLAEVERVTNHREAAIALLRIALESTKAVSDEKYLLPAYVPRERLANGIAAFATYQKP